METAAHVAQTKLLRLYRLDVTDVERGGQDCRVLVFKPARIQSSSPAYISDTCTNSRKSVEVFDQVPRPNV